MLAWSCVSRDGVILVEAGEDDGSGNVIKAAQKINATKTTGGYEKTCSGSFSYRGLKFHVYESCDDNDSGVIIWTFCCIYNPRELKEKFAKAFLTKLVYVTEPLRKCPWWREGGLLSAQQSFAPTLQQQMQSAQTSGQIVSDHMEVTRAIMASNINILGRRDRNFEDQPELNQISKAFKERAKQVKRMQHWQQAKHGFVLGTAITEPWEFWPFHQLSPFCR
jgi:hypothetical protein